MRKADGEEKVNDDDDEEEKDNLENVVVVDKVGPGRLTKAPAVAKNETANTNDFMIASNSKGNLC